MTSNRSTARNFSDSSFPFSGVVGMENAKQALLLCAVDPSIGGVLLRGDKGSAKTTLARSIQSLLDRDQPFVELPLGASEDRVVGTLDIQRALVDNTIEVSDGLLGQAHGGVLYVDEINLLSDHLVDVLLDAAATGTNRIERDGISRSQPAKFILVGSMNPEEGELRPQLLDRFGLCVSVETTTNVADRVQAVSRRLAYDGVALADVPTNVKLEQQDQELARKLAQAQSAMLPATVVQRCCELAVHCGVEGLRSDLVLAKAAAAFAGLEGSQITTEQHLLAVAPLVLAHRGRQDVFDRGLRSPAELQPEIDAVLSAEPQPAPPGPTIANVPPTLLSSPTEELPVLPNEVSLAEWAANDPAEPISPDPKNENPVDVQPPMPPLPYDTSATEPGPLTPASVSSSSEPSSGSPGTETSHPAETNRDTFSDQKVGDQTRSRSAIEGVPLVSTNSSVPTTPSTFPPVKKQPTRLGGVHGRASRDVVFDPSSSNPIAIASTVRNIASKRAIKPDAAVTANDLRQSQRSSQVSHLIVLAVDTSGSMGARDRANAAVGAIRSLLKSAYQNRNRVAMVTFRDDGADLMLSPTRSVEVANLRLSEFKTGGATPLAAGIDRALSVANDKHNRDQRCSIVLLTDGRATGTPDALGRALIAADQVRSAEVSALVLDCETDMPRLKLAAEVAEVMGARYLHLENITPEAISSAIDDALLNPEKRTL